MPSVWTGAGMSPVTTPVDLYMVVSIVVLAIGSVIAAAYALRDSK